MKLNAKECYLIIRSALLSPLLFFRRLEAPDKKEIKKILFLRHDRIGDMVLSTGVFKAFKKAYPAASIMVLASSSNKEVLQNNPDIDEVLVYKGLRRFLKDVGLRKPDLTVDLFYTYELKTAFLTYLSGAKYRLGFENSGREVFFNIKGADMNKACSMIGHLTELISSLGVDLEGSRPQIYLSEEEMLWAGKYLIASRVDKSCPKVAVHPGGFYPSQRWQADGFAEVGRKIIEKFHANVILIGDRNEAGLIEKIKKQIGAEKVFAVYNLALRQVISLLSQCDMLLCNNSGLLHVACVLKIPTVSTMGPTDPVLWPPYGKNNIVVRQDLPCSPCSRGVCNTHRCMALITPRQIEEALDIPMDEISKKYNSL